MAGGGGMTIGSVTAGGGGTQGGGGMTVGSSAVGGSPNSDGGDKLTCWQCFENLLSSSD